MAKRKPIDETGADTDGGGGEPLPTADDIAMQVADNQDTAAALAIEEITNSEEMNEGACRVMRKGPFESKFSFCERVQVSAMRPDLFDFVSRVYGGGKYELWFFRPSGKFHTKKPIEIDPRIPEGEFFKQAKAAVPGEPSTVDKLVDRIAGKEGSGTEGMMLAFMKMSQEQNATMLNMMMQASAQTVTAMSNMVAALGGGGGGGKQGFDMLQALTVFNQLKGKDNAVDPIKLLELAHTWFQENQPNEPEPGWMKLIQALAPVLLGKLAPGGMPMMPGFPMPEPGPAAPGAAAAPPLTLPAAPPLAVNHQPTATAAALPEATASPEDDDPMSIKFMLRLVKDRLVSSIADGATPEDAFDLVNNPLLLTDAQFDQLQELLTRETWAKDLFGDEATVDKHRAWFEEFRKLMRQDKAEPHD